ncbi:hypothetical protein DRE_04041 [Drechslerella stenobrocha 248]|uniref:Uncharacterized protein n=1 Tax=Drechslerella stenobrocha 248 TaxID=1043628 RepID=W7HRV5_9PEZI|nr:hypothetical protein DRE_04041 [Drechslerella stenobrocha 248]
MEQQIRTPLTDLLGIKHPILLAGMARTSSSELAAAVSNAGGLGTIGGLGYTPDQLLEIITSLKSQLKSPDLPFGVDLALPKIGDGARKTNHDYTNGQLDQLITVTIESGARLFVSAVGIPPPHVMKRLHDAKILVMNMVGHPKHAEYALRAGVDIVCAQGGEGGGHTGSIATSILIPAVCDVAKKYKSPMTGKTPLVVAAGGISDGRSLASSLMQGAAGVWVGTRFVASVEAGCSEMHKKESDFGTLWAATEDENERLCQEEGNDLDIPFIMGQVAGVIDDIKPAKDIVEDMVRGAVDMLRQGNGYLVSKL